MIAYHAPDDGDEENWKVRLDTGARGRYDCVDLELATLLAGRRRFRAALLPLGARVLVSGGAAAAGFGADSGAAPDGGGGGDGAKSGQSAVVVRVRERAVEYDVECVGRPRAVSSFCSPAQ